MSLLGPLLAQLVLGQAPAIPVPVESPDLDGAIVGRVCLDENRDGSCADAEPGLQGVRVVMETGQSALTDRTGRYHLAGLRARAPDRLAGGRMQQGRHRLAVDARALPGGGRVKEGSRTVELPLGGLSQQDFAIEPPAASERLARIAYELVPPTAALTDEQVLFTATGKVRPGATVLVREVEAEVRPDGSWRAVIGLSEGPNDVPITARSPDGTIELYVQRFDVVDRSGSMLVAPRELEPTGTITLPGVGTRPAAAGPSTIRVESHPGTRVRLGSFEAVVGKAGVVQVPVTLSAGANELQLSLVRPGQPAREQPLTVFAAEKALLVGLLDLEATYDVARRGPRLFGRGGLHGEWKRGPYAVEGELELRDTDLPPLSEGRLSFLAGPRRPERLDRWLDPERYPTEWGDRSSSSVPNSAEGRLRLEARHELYGGVAFGTHRVLMQDGEVGRYQRLLFGPSATVRSPKLGPLELGASGFYAAGLIDPLRGLATSPAHEELRATGGSLYFLGQPAVIAGSEVVRVEVRDGSTGLPLGEQRLLRGVDYDIDYGAGRILLARPLSFVDGGGLLLGQPYSSSHERVLVVDYEVLQLTVGGRRTLGGEATARVGPVDVAFGAVQEAGAGADRFDLLRARATAPLGPLTLSVEGARSRGAAISASFFGLSSDGGLSYLRPKGLSSGAGQALTARLRGKALQGMGRLDAAFRYRSPGFSDGAHLDEGGERRITVLAEQPFSRFRVGALVDDRVALGEPGAFLTSATEPSVRDARTLGGYAGYHLARLELRLEAASRSLQVDQDGAVRSGSRLGVGALARYQLLDALALIASHHQALARSGEGAGSYDDTLTTAGAEVAVSRAADVGLRVGYGPALGPVAFATGQVRDGANTHYASYSVDVDGPSFGERRMVSGARSELYESGAVFTEDVAAHDATSLRLSKATGFTAVVAEGAQLSVRYERGMRQPFDAPVVRVRDAGGLSASWVREQLSLFGRAELRSEAAPGEAARTVQRVASAAATVAFSERLGWSGRLHFADTYMAKARTARLLEWTTGVSWRGESASVLLQQSYQRELSPSSRTVAGERGFMVVSLLPAVRFTPKLALSAGVHGGQAFAADNSAFILSGSLRPSFNVVGGLEIAAEVAARTSAPDQGELHSVRGELGYRFTEQFLLAAGYTVLGFQGIGFSFERESRDRAYLRAEAGF